MLNNIVSKLISNENKKILIIRFKSFAWRSLMMLTVGLIDFVMTNLGLLNLSTETVVIVGLVLGEVSKELNKRYDLEKIAGLGSAKN